MRKTHLILIAVTAALSAGPTRAALVAQYELEGDAVNSVSPGTGDGVWQPLDPASASYSSGIAPTGTQSAGFDGSNDISVSSSAIGIDSSGAYSVSFWTQTLTSGRSFITNGTASRGVFGTRDFDFFTTNSTTLVFSGLDATSEVFRINGAVAVTGGSVHHVVGTFDGTTNTDGAKLYVDGALVDTATASGLPTNTHDGILLGGSTGGFGLNGLLDDVRFYDHSLSPTEVTTLFGGATGGGPAELIDHYEFESNGTDSATAIDGDANNGAVGSNLGFTTGQIGQGVQLTRTGGVDNSVTVPLADAFAPGNVDFSIAYWMKRDSPGDNVFETNFDALSGTGVGYQMLLLDNAGVGGTTTPNGLRLRLDDDGGLFDLLDSTTSFDDTEFHHVAVVIDRTAGTATFYVDGVAETPLALSITGGIVPNQDLLLNNFAGVLDDLRFYRGALTDAEVQALAGVTNTIPTPAALPVGLAMLGGIAMRRRC